MPVETRPTSRFWYGRWRRNGQRRCKRLKVLVRGQPDTDAFELSRQEAEAELARLVEEEDKARHPEELVQRLHELKFGKRIGAIRLSRLADEWLALPRKRTLSKGRATFTRTVIGHFVDHVSEHHPKVQEMSGITAEMAEQFMRSQQERGISGRTYNAILSLLRSAFERLRVRAGMLANPFRENLVFVAENSQSRQPFTSAELNRLFEAAGADREMHALLVTGACTALRRGDACCLKWQDVNLETNRIRIHTRKTGEKVAIPILPMLREVLQSRPRSESPHVFPALAAAYLHEPGTINKRLNTVFKRAGLRASVDRTEPQERPVLDIPDEDSFRPAVLAKLRALTDADVAPRIREAMIQIFDLYSSGMTLPDIARDLGISKGSASNYLTRIEKVAGHPIVRLDVKVARESMSAAPAQESSATARNADDRKDGLIAVNTRGFHAFRATFTTMALSAGVPVEVVKLITGHTVTETVLKHYFNPDERTVFAAVEANMPRLLTGKTPETPIRTEMCSILEATSAKTWKRDVAHLRELAAKLTM